VVHVNVGTTNLESFTLLCEEVGASVQPEALTTCCTYLTFDQFQDVYFVNDNVPLSPEIPHYHFDHKATLENILHVGDKLCLTWNGVAQAVEVLDVDLDEELVVPTYCVLLNDEHDITVTKEFLHPPTDDDIDLSPVTPVQVQQHAAQLDTETLEALLNPTDLLKNFVGWHTHLGHLPFSDMFKLATISHLPNCYTPKFFINI
jgi:hypothetical protein